MRETSSASVRDSPMSLALGLFGRETENLPIVSQEWVLSKFCMTERSSAERLGSVVGPSSISQNQRSRSSPMASET